MLVFVLDDEPLLLRKLKRTIEEVLPEADVRDFTRVSAAVKMMETEDIVPDLLFLDGNLSRFGQARGMKMPIGYVCCASRLWPYRWYKL
jgi:hypothetical protein